MKLIIIDTNVYNLVFGDKKDEHLEYKIVYDKVMNNNDIEVIVGGTKYKKEISGVSKEPYNIKIIEQNYKQKLYPLKVAEALKEYEDEKVDKMQIEVIDKFCNYYPKGKTESLKVDDGEIDRNLKIINKIKNNQYTKQQLKTLLINELEIKPDFDDPHIIALLNVSKSKNVLTEDKRAMPFIKQKLFYNDNQIPRIHTKQSIKTNGLLM